ncbi:MAG TPA: MFS transporter [Rhodoglobus sp.]|nr:MFS transporter [Rhodoglobus sp.]
MTRDQRLVLVIAILASFVAFLDGSVINVALPAIREELGGGLATQQWVVDAYLITLGSLILLAGSLSDVFGRIVVLRAGLIGFGIASVLIALAPTPELLIALRAVQGVAGALLVPSSLALIISEFRDAAQAKAIGLWTAWTSASFLAGPVLGGLFVDLLSWRLVFAINVLPIAITVWLLVVLGRRDRRREGARVDVVGAILGVLALGGPVFALIEQGRLGWSHPGILIPLIAGAVALAAFLWWERRTPQPMLPLGLFRNRNFAWGNLATTFVYAALSLGPFVLTLFLQQQAGYPATLAALATLPVSLGNVLLSGWFGSLSGRYGPRLFMTLGPIIAGLGFLLFLSVRSTDVDYWWQVLPGVLVFALGLSMTVAPLTSAILGSIPETEAGIASAVNNAVSRVAGLVAIAMVGVIVAGTLDVDGLHRVVIAAAALFIVGGLVSFAGIRNPKRQGSSAAPVETA